MNLDIDPFNTTNSLATMTPRYILTLLLYSICFGFFSYQLSVLLLGYLDPGPARLHTVLQNKNLSEANVSLVLKICYTPSYNNTLLNLTGYDNVMTYFLGVSGPAGSNKSIGWAGENKTEDVAGM